MISWQHIPSPFESSISLPLFKVESNTLIQFSAIREPLFKWNEGLWQVHSETKQEMITCDFSASIASGMQESCDACLGLESHCMKSDHFIILRIERSGPCNHITRTVVLRVYAVWIAFNGATKSICWTDGILSLLACQVGEFGYLIFPDVESDLLKSFGNKNFFMNVARIGMAVVRVLLLHTRPLTRFIFEKRKLSSRRCQSFPNPNGLERTTCSYFTSWRSLEVLFSNQGDHPVQIMVACSYSVTLQALKFSIAARTSHDRGSSVSVCAGWNGMLSGAASSCPFDCGRCCQVFGKSAGQ